MNEDTGTALAAELGGPSRARFYQVDVTDTASVAAAVTAAAEWSRSAGGAPLGGVVPAAGIGLPALIMDGKHRPARLDALDLVLGVNLRGTLDLVRQALPHIAAASPDGGEGPDGERGVVVMVASSAAFDGQMGQVAYAASKGAVAAMTLPMARDLSRHGIRVLTIAPSLFETNMTKAMSDKVRKSLLNSLEFPKRPGKPEEFAALVIHLIENTMLNGEVIRLDGASRMPARL